MADLELYECQRRIYEIEGQRLRHSEHDRATY